MKHCAPRTDQTKACAWLQTLAIASTLTVLATGAVGLNAQTTSTTTTQTSASRNFPAMAKVGTLVVGANSQATIDGETVRTAPGLRIYNTDNALVHAYQVKGAKVKVRYVMEASTGFLHTVWILRPNEIPKRSWFGFGPEIVEETQTKPLPSPKQVDSSQSTQSSQ